jgi:dedicator of cytokinesis protein 3
MVVQHQRLTFTIPKLSELLVYQARLWEKIGSTSRPKPEYFRVVSPADQ